MEDGRRGTSDVGEEKRMRRRTIRYFRKSHLSSRASSRDPLLRGRGLTDFLIE